MQEKTITITETTTKTTVTVIKTGAEGPTASARTTDPDKPGSPKQ